MVTCTIKCEVPHQFSGTISGAILSSYEFLELCTFPSKFLWSGEVRVAAHAYTVNSLWNLNLQPVSPPCNPPQGSVIFQGSFFFLYWSVVLPVEESLDSRGPWIWLLEVILWNGCLQSWRFGSWFLLVCFSSKPIFVKCYYCLGMKICPHRIYIH